MVITKRYWQYACTFWEMFSFVFLVKTLFSPWKNITDEYPDKGFDLNLIFQAFTMNCITRCIGFVIRLSTLTFGIAVQLALLSIYVCYFLFWITFPFIVAIGGQFLIVTLLS